MGAGEDGGDGLRGVVLAVRRGSTVIDAAGGPADAETGIACTADTRFAVASVSKQFTAAAVLLLVERGALALDDPLVRWFDQGPGWWREVTVEHLLTHTSGLGHWDDVGGIERFCALDVEERRAAIRAMTPHAAPGQHWAYSGPGYLLLGHLVERVANRGYGAFLPLSPYNAPGGLRQDPGRAAESAAGPGTDEDMGPRGACVVVDGRRPR